MREGQGRQHPRAIVVLGMHRSGTSAFARGLRALGVELGRHLCDQPAADNAKGFWEDRDIVALDDELYAHLGMCWSSARPIPPALWQAASLEPFRRRAAALLEAHFGEARLWGFKDPRVSRLLPFWKSVLANLGVTPAFLIVVRNPLSVARSLQRRNGFDAQKCHFLWLSHTLPLPEATEGFKRVCLDYGELLASPREALGRIVHALDLPVSEASAPAIDDYVREFLDASLCHSDFSEAQAVHSEGVGRLSGQAYRLLGRVVRGELTMGAEAFAGEWQRICAEVRRLEPVIAHLDAVEEAIRQLGRRENDGLRSEIVRLNALVQQRDQEIGRLGRVIESASEELRGLAEKSLAQAEDVRSLQRRRHEQDGEVERLRGELAHTRQQLDQSIVWLNRERYTVLKPLARSLYRRGVKLAMGLPEPLRRLSQRWKRRLLPGHVSLELTAAAFAASPLPDQAADGISSARRAPLVRQALEAAEGGYDVIVFPVIDWHFRVQRPQHLARQLAAEGHRVFYLTTTFGEGRPGFRILESPAERVFVCQLCLSAPHPRIYEDPLGPEGELGLSSALKSLADTCQLGQIVSILDLPFWRAVAQALPGSTLIYDCMDYHAGFSTNAPAMLQEEERLLQEADLVITTSARLSEKVAEVTPNRLIRNAGEVDFFRVAPPRLHYRSDRPVVGYFGAIADWFDIELVAAAARTYAEWDFVLVGSTYQCDTKRAERMANVHFIGEVPYADLPGYLHAFDVCLIPFKETELTRCTNPVKVYEYLAAGKPVVATALPEVQLIAEQLHVARDRGEFIQALATAMGERQDRALAESRAQWARQHDWRARIRELNEALRGLFPKVSVIVLTYDNLAFTRACLDSLERYTHYPDWELILVDNASRDGSVEFLQDYAERHERVRLLSNAENLGFAAGNNQGLAAATGEVLILLNNDTYVTPGWMTGLVRHLRRRPELGMVGPVTNNIGNEARIDISYRNMGEMLDAAFAYTRAHARELLYNDTVAFFCAAMTRQAYAAVGPLEEAFGQGFFEDDDYCNRLRGKGYKVAIAEDVFVHHHLSASFGQLEDPQRRALFERNKAIYEQKWGPWIPHKYRD